MTRRRHNPLGQLKHVRATADDLAMWPLRDRNFRTCFHCGTAYIAAGYATQCEQLHEHEDEARNKAAHRRPGRLAPNE